MLGYEVSLGVVVVVRPGLPGVQCGGIHSVRPSLRFRVRVKLAAAGDKNDGKTGTVIEVQDTGYVVVRFKGGLRQYFWSIRTGPIS